MINAIEQIVRDIFHCDAAGLSQFENVTNNSVYSFECNDRPYIFKLYRSKYWPEDGKPQFVNQLLLNNGIPCAELIAFTRENPEFPNGYLIEQKINGCTADKLQFSQAQEVEFYKDLAGLVSEIHRIPVKGFGYMGSGEGAYESMHSFFDDEFDELTESFLEKGRFAEAELQTMKNILIDTLKRFDDLPAVLCHGDLSKKNVLVQEDGSLLLIDWDDVMAYNWMADIARFTFWMHMTYNEQDYMLFRNTFMDHYNGPRKEEFDDFEKAFHLYVSLDVLNFAINTGNSDMQQFSEAYIQKLCDHWMQIHRNP